MEKKGLIFFTVSINLLCLVYGCTCIIWCYWGIEVLLGSIINIISMIFCIKMLAEHSRKGRIVVASAAVMLFIYALVYLTFDKAFSPLSFLIAGGFYGVTAAFSQLFNQDINKYLHLNLGVGFMLLAFASIFILLKYRKVNYWNRFIDDTLYW